jgi:leader peptidase (prepilin peptidase)/N-methyltransferase
MLPDWIWYAFTFAVGCCAGSFVNVVVWRMPRDMSVVKPPSSCPACGGRIAFYDNVPLVSWIALGFKCRRCKAPISSRYFVIELLTGAVFTGLFFLLFRSGLRTGVPPFTAGGWLLYAVTAITAAALIAASAIDLEFKIIPLSICWFITFVGLAGSAAGPLAIDPGAIRRNGLLPSASINTAPLAAGAAVGLAVSWLLLATGLLKRSYTDDREGKNPRHRREMLREIAFLAPVLACSAAAWGLSRRFSPVYCRWFELLQYPAAAGLLGSLWGYFAGCGLVWLTRVAGTVGFGREAMGLGDVHLMGGAGAVLGAGCATAAFFAAPFLGLVWAAFHLFFRKTREIPYGPFLSLGIAAVIIFHDFILGYLGTVFVY